MPPSITPEQQQGLEQLKELAGPALEAFKPFLEAARLAALAKVAEHKAREAAWQGVADVAASVQAANA